jgi:anti-sigma regulatory factor (Ser/Thr protein kinase)
MRVNPEKGRRSTTGGQVSYPNEPAHASDLRAFVGAFLDRSGVDGDVADEILMAVGEVVANACLHGRPVIRLGHVDLGCERHNGHVSITVTDDGPGFDVDAVLQDGMPALLSQGGRGFFLMRQLMDRVDVVSSPDGTTVTVGRDLG